MWGSPAQQAVAAAMHEGSRHACIGAHSITHPPNTSALALEFVRRAAQTITSLGVRQQRLQGGSSSSDGAHSTHATSGRH